MFDVVKIENAGAPFPSDGAVGANDYSCFEPLVRRFGIYVFEDTADGGVLYVGQAWKQDLKNRICQNYTEKDTGGTFRNNWCKCENKTFQDFQRMLSTASVKIVCVPENAGVLICAIEAILISALEPRFNK